MGQVVQKKRLRPWFRSVCVPIAVLALASGCGERAVDGALVILQNQKGQLDGAVCVGSRDPDAFRGLGLLDVSLDKPYPYFAYPLVRNERSQIVFVEGVKVAMIPPPAIARTWESTCPLAFEWPFSIALDPGDERSLTIEALPICVAAQMTRAFETKVLAEGESAFVEVELRAAGRSSGGSVVTSPPFTYPIRICFGCLQPDFPIVYLCSQAPSKNPFRGNPCNIAQDEGPVFCCADDMTRKLRCPAPDRTLP